jgi:hypothetical protein
MVRWKDRSVEASGRIQQGLRPILTRLPAAQALKETVQCACRFDLVGAQSCNAKAIIDVDVDVDVDVAMLLRLLTRCVGWLAL